VPSPFSSPRFRRWYAIAWLVLAAIYCVVFLIAGTDSFPRAAAGALVYVVPMSLLGLGAIAIFRRMDWNTGHRLRFAATHVVLGLAFGLLVTASNFGLFTILHGVSPTIFTKPQANPAYMAWESLMGGMIYGVLAGVCYAILVHERMREHEARAARAAALQTEAELRALRAQLNPHFLFNTLHSLLALVRHDPRAAENALEQFGDLLRYTLDTQKNGEVVPLREELAFVESYLALESLRLGDRLRLDVRVDEAALARKVPAFSIQPLVENAVRHGIAPRASGGTVALAVGFEDGALRIDVEDDGAGAAPSEIAAKDGLGLKLVRERLAVHFAEGASLSVASERGKGLRATIRIGNGAAP
jgi:signal transduction histidine kinase